MKQNYNNNATKNSVQNWQQNKNTVANKRNDTKLAQMWLENYQN